MYVCGGRQNVGVNGCVSLHWCAVHAFLCDLANK